MCESRTVPSGKVYRQLFDAQVQLSRSLLAGRRDTRTDCLSAEDSETHCSTTSRCVSSRGRQVDADDDVDDVSRLPDSVVVDRPSSDIIERLTEKKSKKHKEALRQLETELTHLSQVCESQVRTVSLELLSSLREVDLRLNTLKEQMEQRDHGSVQEVCVLWEQVEQEVRLKKTRITELKLNLSEAEARRANEIRAVLRSFLHLLQSISFLSPPDVCRLIHTEATMLNQSLLANRRSAARLLLLLQEENLQQEALLRLHWEDCLSGWRGSRVSEVLDRFRALCSTEEGQPVPGQLVPGQLIPGQLVAGQLVPGQLDLAAQREEIICQICALVPPTCSTVLVSDWFNQLTAVNHQIDSLHADFLLQLRCSYDQRWQTLLELCEEALSALQLEDEEVNAVISSQLLPLIGRRQSEDEERLAALHVCCDSLSQHTVSLGRCVFAVMRGAALLWETHCRRIKSREEELQQQLDDLRRSQQQHTQRWRLRLDDLLGCLRQESSEDALKTSLDKTVLYLQEVQQSCSQCVCEQWEVLERLPSLLLQELLSYSCSLSAFFHLTHTYTPTQEELQRLHPSLCAPAGPAPPGPAGPAPPETSEKPAEENPTSCQRDSGPAHPGPTGPAHPGPTGPAHPGPTGPAHPAQDWLSEAESSLLELCDISSDVTFTSSRGVVYGGPAFRCPAPDLKTNTHLSLFPAELLTHKLSRLRTLFLDQLQQHVEDVLRSAAAVVTDRKEAARSEQEVQLQQLNPERITTHIYQPRLAELQLHRQQVDAHCEDVGDVLSTCRTALQELSTSISRRNQEFIVHVSNMEDGVLTAASSVRRLEALSSALQDCQDKHIRDTQRCHTSFRREVQVKLEEVRTRTTHLLCSFRLFSEGGDFAPQEVKLFQRRLKEETKQIRVVEESLFSELEELEARSLQQVKEATSRLEEKLSLLRSEVEFMEEIQRIISRSRVEIRAEASLSNQQQFSISSCLENLKETMKDSEVSPDQVCCVLSSVSGDLKRRFQYLDSSAGQQDLSAGPPSRKQGESAPPAGRLQTGRAVELDDPAVDVIRTLNRLCEEQEGGAEEEQRGAAAGVTQRLHHRGTESVSTLRRGCRSIRTEKKFQVFGAEPGQNPSSFSSMVDSLLRSANDQLLQTAEEFYLGERLSRFLLLPDSLDQWAESTQQRLLGYQEQSRKFLSTSREELLSQLSVLDGLLTSLPGFLISNHERQQGAGLMEAVGGVRQKLEETLTASEEEKRVNVRQLRVSLREDELQSVIRKEDERQQQLQRDISTSHLEQQVCLQVRGEEFVTSLSSLAEQLLHLLDELPTAGGAAEHLEAPADTLRGCSRTWSGVPFLTPPTDATDDPPSTVTTATTPSITTTRCTLGHLSVIKLRDAAVKRFQQIFHSEFRRSAEMSQRRLEELQLWSSHWKQQTHTLTHTHSDTHTL